MSSKNNQTSVVKPNTSNNKKYYEDNEIMLKGAVVLCQHGFLGNETTINPLFDNLKSNVLKSYFSCEFCDGVIKATDLNSSNSAIQEVVNKHNANPEHNLFIRTLFSNPTYGAVSTQASELRDMIKLIRNKIKNVPIVVLGYSKGGVVNCKCAIDNPGLIDKIINVGTPHDDTLVQDIIQIIGNGLKDIFGSFFGIPIKPARDAIQALVDWVNDGVDNLLNETVTYKNLKDEWNRLMIKPKFTPIAGEAIVINGEFNGDFVVPTESAIANGFRGRSYLSIIDNFIVRDDRVEITTSQLRNAMGDGAAILDILSKFSESILNFDAAKIIECLFDIVANLVSNDGDMFKCLKLAHTSFFGRDEFLLTHNTIGMRVLAGLNA